LRAYPKTRVRVLDGSSSEVVEHVRSGSADLGVAEHHGVGELDVHPLRDDPLVIVLPQGHVLGDRAVLAWRMLTTERFIAFSAGSGIRRLTDLAFAHTGAQPDTFIETGAVATAGAMVAAGLGVSAVPELVLPLLSTTGLVVRPVNSPTITRQLAILTRPESTPSAPVTNLHNELLKAATDCWTTHATASAS
jgi:LysR family carnitine catabolism transcriptional activator